MRKKLLRLVLTCVVFTCCMSIMAVATAADLSRPVDHMDNKKYEFTKFVDAEGHPDLGVVGYLDMDRGADYSDYIVRETILIPVDDNTYQITTVDGEVIGFYNDNPVIIPRGGGSFKWTAGAGESVCSNSPIESYNGLVMQFSVAFSSSGKTRVGFGAVEEGAFYTIFTKTDGFSGTITFTRSFGPVVFGFCNDSNHSITYTGSLRYSE